jgi:glycosyltransferase involved in cell wall biosynthesis
MQVSDEHVILSNYPLSRAFRQQLEQRFGRTLGFVNIAELRQVSLTNLLLALRQVRAERLSVATEDQASVALLPVLELFAAFTRARSLQAVDAELEVRVFSRGRAIRHGIALAGESLRAAVDLLWSQEALRRLSRTARTATVIGGSKLVVYLNCNLWFGVKAGGSVGHISGVANALMDAGRELMLFTAGDRLLVDERAKLVPLPPPRTLALPVETSYYRFGRRCFTRVRKRLQRAELGFIYQRMSLCNYTGVALSRRLGVPLVLEYNGSEAWVAKNWGRPLRFYGTAALAEEVNIHHAHIIVTVSDVLRDELLERGVEPARIVTYPNCIDPRTFDPERFPPEVNARTRAELGCDSGEVIATFIGTFGRWHGVDVLAQAIRRMVLERRERLEALRLRFVLIGDGQKMPVVRETLSIAQADRYVRLVGLVPQREAPRFLAASDLLLSPHVGNADGSRFFGSPTKLFEYMAMGRGIVASDLDQIGEVLRPAISLPAAAEQSQAGEGAVAVLVPPGDVDALMDAIELLAANPALRAALGSNARRLALGRYTWRHHVAAILDGVNRLGLSPQAQRNAAAAEH